MTATTGDRAAGTSPPATDPRWDDIVGLRVTTAARTVSAGECAILTSMTWARGPLHTDATAAGASLFGRLSLAGPLVTALAAGLWATSTLMPTLTRRHGIRLVALAGSHARYLRPLLVGDTVSLHITVTEARRSRKTASRAVLTLTERLVNQHDECVAEIVEHVLGDIVG